MVLDEGNALLGPSKRTSAGLAARKATGPTTVKVASSAIADAQGREVDAVARHPAIAIDNVAAVAGHRKMDALVSSVKAAASSAT